MPGIDGLEFCKIVRRYTPNTTIAIFSAAVGEGGRDELLETVDIVCSKLDGVSALVQQILLEKRSASPPRVGSAKHPLVDISRFASAAASLDAFGFATKYPGPVFWLSPPATNFSSQDTTTRFSFQAKQAGHVVVRLNSSEESAPLKIGRSPVCDVVLPVPGVSRVHASFSTARSTLTDLGSSFGTFAAGARLARNASVPLATEDELRLGPISMTFLSNEDFYKSILANSS
jgi:CheY-like chemotaxis protein